MADSSFQFSYGCTKITKSTTALDLLDFHFMSFYQNNNNFLLFTALRELSAVS